MLNGYMSTLQFLDDLIKISEKISENKKLKKPEKKQILINEL